MKHIPTKKGFTILVAVVTASLLLLVSMSIAGIALKQQVLSGAGKDSQIAFYAADTGIECAMYWDLKQGSFVENEENTGRVQNLICNGVQVEDLDGNPYEMTPQNPTTGTKVFEFLIPDLSSAGACSIVTVTKSYTGPTVEESEGELIGYMHHHYNGLDGNGCAEDPVPFYATSGLQEFDYSAGQYCALSSITILSAGQDYTVSIAGTSASYSSTGVHNLGAANDQGDGVTVTLSSGGSGDGTIAGYMFGGAPVYDTNGNLAFNSNGQPTDNANCNGGGIPFYLNEDTDFPGDPTGSCGISNIYVLDSGYTVTAHKVDGSSFVLEQGTGEYPPWDMGGNDNTTSVSATGSGGGSDTSGRINTKIESRGYNTCRPSLRRLERGIEANY